MKTRPLREVGPASWTVFETMRTYGGRVFRLEQHVQRLCASAHSSGMRVGIARARLARDIKRALKRKGEREVMLRVTLRPGGPDTLIVPNRSYPARYYARGVRLVTSTVRRAPANHVGARIKGRDYLSGVLAHADGRGRNAFEILLLSADGHVAEAPTSNIFIVKRGILFTPPLWEGVLDGVTRRFVMELAGEEGIECEERPVLRQDLYNSDECFLTNTSMEIMPVIAVDGRTIGAGRLGPVTADLRRAFRKATRRDA